MIRMTIKIIKRTTNYLFSRFKNIDYNKNSQNVMFIFDQYVQGVLSLDVQLNFDTISNSVMAFFNKMKTDESNWKYCATSKDSCIYGAVYFCLTSFLHGKNGKISEDQRLKLIQYFNSYQRPDGLFVDPKLEGDKYYNCEWWGANHLSLHLITCYNYLNEKPPHQFQYIKKYYNKDFLIDFLDKLEFEKIMLTDSDNAIMNLGGLLQYQRDFFNDTFAAEALDILFTQLEKKINNNWGAWGIGDSNDPVYLSRVQQFAYHLYSLWIYDGRKIMQMEKLIDLSLGLQTFLGGTGAKLNTSACEDIDSIFILSKLSRLTDYRRPEIVLFMRRALPWVLSNQNLDGGFVFRRNESLAYGHPLMTSSANESQLFATWFRTLSLAYIAEVIQPDLPFEIKRCPGYHF